MRRVTSSYGQKPIKISHYEYNIAGKIGAGANSDVYQGIDLISGKKVSIKKIKNHIGKREEMMLKNQIQALSDIKHQNVVWCFDVYKQQRFTYIFTQLCEMNLAGLIINKMLDQKKALHIFTQIVNGYQQIRKKRFIHRDIKPTNIFLNKNQVKIGDFGYCTTLTEQFIKEDFNLGSPLYMPPQSLEYNIYSQASDIWSLGIILYEMLGKQMPFRGKDEKDYLSSMKKSKIKKINCSEQAWIIITSCLALDPKLRPNVQTLKNMLNDINTFSEQKLKSQRNLKRSNQSNTLSSKQEPNYLKIIQNQILYVKFLERMVNLTQKCQLKHAVMQKVVFLFEYYSKMRIHYLKNIFSTNQQTKPISLQKKQQLLIFIRNYQRNHQQTSQKKIELNSDDRLKIFERQTATFKRSLIWQIQACMKQYIRIIWSQLKQINTEQQSIERTNEIILLDFLITAFQLNSLLIQIEDNAMEFAKQSYLALIMTCPITMSIGTFRKIEGKYKTLKF